MALMENKDNLQRLLIEFFDLPESTPPEELTQKGVATWDSLAMVQLIGELQGTFNIEFNLDEIESLRSYAEIRGSLIRKGVALGAG